MLLASANRIASFVGILCSGVNVPAAERKREVPDLQRRPPEVSVPTAFELFSKVLQGTLSANGKGKWSNRAVKRVQRRGFCTPTQLQAWSELSLAGSLLAINRDKSTSTHRPTS